MKKTIIYLFLACLIFSEVVARENSIVGDKIQDGLPPPSTFLLNNSTWGKDFWLAIPQNEDVSANLRAIGIEILVTSLKKATVKLEIPSLAKFVTKQVEPFKQVVFSTKKNDLGWDMEVIESEKVGDQGIHITSDEYITISVINAKEFSGEGYHLLPVSSWGKEYYHSGYYDFYQNNLERGGGFLIVASEAGTKVTIQLNGEGTGYSTTLGGKKIGETITASLNEGQTYMVRGKGKTTGLFDLSGTKILSNKPIGVISFHMRTMIPSLGPDDRGNIMEMLTPVPMWSKDHACVFFDRNPKGGTQGLGDLFRVIASQPKTDFHVDWYDPETDIKKGQSDGKGLAAGEFREVEPIKQIYNNNKLTSVWGASYWVSNNPIQIMQYAFSQQWDSDTRWSPMAALVSPMDQFISAAVFQTPDETGFNENQLTLMAVGEPDDPNSVLLKTVAVDGSEIYKKDVTFLANRIPGTNLYWSRLTIEPGVHYITSQTKLSGYLAGFSSSSCYGYPVALGTKVLDQYDVEKPVIKITESCASFTVEATETKVGTETQNPRQNDVGISAIFLLDESSQNMTLSLINPANFKPQNKVTKQSFSLAPIDEHKAGKAVFAILDRAGNYTIDSVRFVPESAKFNLQLIDFGKTRIKQPKLINLNLSNPGEKVINVTNIKLKKGTLFTLADTNQSKGMRLNSGESANIGIKYLPLAENANDDLDSLIVTSECDVYPFWVLGRGIRPVIQVGDIAFDSVEVQKEICLEAKNGSGLRIDNTGSDTLTITSIDGIADPFFIRNQNIKFPYKILPGDLVYFKSICFNPILAQQYDITATIQSDAESGKNTVKITGKGFKKQDTTSVDNKQLTDFGFEIHPNPTDGLFKLELNTGNSCNLDISLFDMRGSHVKTLTNSFVVAGSHQMDLDPGSLAEGVYLLRIILGTRVEVARLIISR